MFGTGTTGFAVITAILALLTYAVVFILLKSDRQFYRNQQSRFLDYFSWRPGLKTVRSGLASTKSMDSDLGGLQSLAQRAHPWKTEHVGDV